MLSDPNLRDRMQMAFALVRHIDLELDEDGGEEWILANWNQLAELTGYCLSLSKALFELAAGRPALLPPQMHSGSAYDFFVG